MLTLIDSLADVILITCRTQRFDKLFKNKNKKKLRLHVSYKTSQQEQISPSKSQVKVGNAGKN
jgi:hypothetical protein